MSRLEGGLHGLKAYPSARSDDQDFRHGVMLLVGLAWLIVMCNAGSRTARRAGRLHMKAVGGSASPRCPLCGGRGRRLRWLWRQHGAIHSTHSMRVRIGHSPNGIYGTPVGSFWLDAGELDHLGPF